MTEQLQKKVDFAIRLGVSHTTVRLKAKQMGLVHQKMSTVSVWSQEQINYLIEHFHNSTLDDLSQHIGFSTTTIANKARKLGLKKDSDYCVHDFYRRFVKDYKNAV